LGDVPVIVGANGHVITKLDALGPGDVSDRLTVAQNLVAGTESQVFIFSTNESQNQIEDSIGTSEIGPSTRVTENLSLHENGYNFSTEESSCNMTCQKNQEAVKVHPQATLSQMQYVKFFSHIEPVWFPDDREYVDTPLDFMNNGGEVPCT
jgi:hypothetical protein